MAAWQASSREIERAGASIVALSVDDGVRSEAMRRQLKLKFPILCDTRREVVKAMDLYNAEEKGGIAVPAVLVIDHGGRVRHRWTEHVAARIDPRQLAELLETDQASHAVEPKTILPGLSSFARAVINSIRRGVVTPHS